MNQPNDWFATLMFNEPSSYDEVIANGITPDNTTIQSADYYKNLAPVQEKFTENGKFNEQKFNDFYTSALTTYNEFANEDWTQKLLSGMAKDPYDWTEPMNTNVKEFSVRLSSGLNPERRSMGLSYMGSVGDPTFSISEIAQGNYVRDENGNKLDWTPHQHAGLFKTLFDPTLALAVYEEDGTHEENGITVSHRKGQYKVDENGDPYYEILGARDSYGREVLHWTDNFTVEGSTLNKYDFFDSDGLTKSIGKTIAKSIVQMAPFLIPGVGETIGTIGVATGLASVMPTMAKSINSMFTDGNNGLGKELNKLENFVAKLSPSMSEAGRGSFFNLENISSILVSSASQLFSQRQLANITQTIARNTGKIDPKLGRSLSLAWLAATSSNESYASLKEAGANDVVAGIGLWANMAALYGLMNIDYFRDQLFKGTFMDETETIDVVNNWLAKEGSRTAIAKNPVDPKEAVGLFNRMRKGFSEMWQKTPWFGTKQATLAAEEVGEGIEKTLVSQAWGAGKRIVNRAANEGVEEMMEEVSADLINVSILGLQAMGLPVSEDDTKKVDFGYNLADVLKRYGSTLVGGALGGATFEALDIYHRHIGPKVVGLMDLDAQRQMNYLIASGHADEMRDRVKLLYKKGLLGNKNLSAIETLKDKDGNDIYAKGTDTDNQNLANYNLLMNHITYLENILENEGMMSLLRFQMDPNKSILDGEPTLNDVYKEEVDKDNELNEDGLEAGDFFARNKENAITRTIQRYKLDTSYVNDVVDLGTKIVEARAALDELIGQTPNGRTDAEREAIAESRQNDEKVKYWKNKLKELRKQRENLVYGKNDDFYANQLLVTTQKYAHEPWLGGTKFGIKEIDEKFKNPYWLNSVEGYVKTRYGKDFYKDLNDTEKEELTKEYNEIKKTSGIDQLILISKLQYALKEQTSDQLKALNDKLLKYNLDSYFKHDLLSGYSTEFENYIKNINEVNRVDDQIRMLKKNREDYKTQQKKSDEELAGDEEYRRISDNITDLEITKAELNANIDVFEAKYGTYEEHVLNPAITKQGHKNFYSAYRSSLDEISRLNKYLNLVQQQSKLVGDLAGINTSTTGMGDDEIASDVLKQRQIIESRLAAIDTTLKEPIFSDLKDVDVLEKKKEAYQNILDTIESLYTHLQDNQILSEGDEPLKMALATIIAPIVNNFDERFEQANKNTDDGLPGELHDSLFTKENQEALKTSIKDYLSNLRDGNLSAALDSHNSIISRLNDIYNGQDIDVNEYATNLLNDITEGVNLFEFLTSINAKKEGVETFSIVDLLRDFNLNISESTLSVIDAIESEHKRFTDIKSMNAYLMDRALYRKALNEIPLVVNLLATIVNNATDGTNTILNTFRKKAGKSLLVDNLSNHSANIIRSDMSYLLDKVHFLTNLSSLNEKDQKEFHKVSDVISKTSFLRNLFMAKDAEDSIFSKFKKAGIDLDELYREAGSPDYENANIDNFENFNTGFIKFNDLLYEAGQKLEKEDLENLVVSTLPENLTIIDSGEISDKSDSSLTPYSTTVYLGTLFSLRNSTYWGATKGLINDSNNKIVPIIGQEWNIQLALASIADNSLFNKIIEKIAENSKAISTDDDSDVYLATRQALVNTLFIQGGAGAGKTTLMRNIHRISQQWYGEDYSAIVVAPHQTQLDGLKSLGINQQFLLKDVIEKIAPNKSEFKVNDTNKHIHQLDNVNITTDSKVLFNKDTKKKVIYLDEATFVSEGDWQILTAWAAKNNVSIIAAGDPKQSGVTMKSPISDAFQSTGLEDCLYITGPELTQSIRVATVAKKQNLQNVEIPLKEVLRYYKQNPKATSKELDEKLIGETKLGIDLVYYDGPNSFAGEKQIESSEIEKYLDKFIKFSKEKNEDNKAKVALITDKTDAGKYSGKEITIINHNAVQGGEFDYVIIDVDLSKVADDYFNQYRKFYTLMSRSKYGSGIVFENTEFKDKAHLNFKPVEAGIDDAPISFIENSDDLKEWKLNILKDIEATEVKEISTNESDSTEDTSDETPEQKEEATNLIIESTKSDLDTEEEKPSIDTSKSNSSISAKTQKSTEESIEAGKKSITGNKTKVAKSRKAETQKPNSYDRMAFIDHIESVDFITKERANSKSFLHVLGNNVVAENNYRSLVRHLSSAFMVNMPELTSDQGDILVQNTGISLDQADAFREAYNVPASRKYRAVKVDSNNSDIYWVTTIDGKEYEIPIARIRGQVEGYSVLDRSENLFKSTYNPVLVKDEKNPNIPIKDALSYGKLFGQLKIFAPTDQLPENDPNYDFYKNNKGKLFAIWSESELVTERDLEDIFKFKYENGNKVFFIDVQEGVVHEEGTYTLKNGAKIKLIPVHRLLTVPMLYDIVNIMRFANGSLNYDKLTAEQQRLIGNSNIAEQHTAAIEFIRGVFGHYTLDNTIKHTDEERRAQLHDNLKQLAKQYKLLSSDGHTWWLNAVYSALKSNKTLFNGFVQNINNLLRREPVRSKTINTTTQLVLQLDFRTNQALGDSKLRNPNFKDNYDKYASYVVRFRVEGTDTYFDVFGYNKTIYNGENRLSEQKVATVKVKGKEFNIAEIINAINKSSHNTGFTIGDGNKNLSESEVDTAIKDNKVVMQFIQIKTDDDKGKIYYNEPNDYELVFKTINGIKNLDLGDLDAKIRQHSAFKNGIYLNDIGGKYKVGSSTENSEQSTPWRVAVGSQESNLPIMTDIRAMASSVFVLNAIFDSTILETNPDSTPPFEEETKIYSFTDLSLTKDTVLLKEDGDDLYSVSGELKLKDDNISIINIDFKNKVLIDSEGNEYTFNGNITNFKVKQVSAIDNSEILILQKNLLNLLDEEIDSSTGYGDIIQDLVDANLSKDEFINRVIPAINKLLDDKELIFDGLEPDFKTKSSQESNNRFGRNTSLVEEELAKQNIIEDSLGNRVVFESDDIDSYIIIDENFNAKLIRVIKGSVYIDDIDKIWSNFIAAKMEIFAKSKTSDTYKNILDLIDTESYRNVLDYLIENFFNEESGEWIDPTIEELFSSLDEVYNKMINTRIC